MQVFTRSQIRAAREKWAQFLMVPGRKKAVGALDKGDGHRCCLGHGCFLFNIKKSKLWNNTFAYGANGAEGEAPDELVEMLGLWDDLGGTFRLEKDIDIFKDMTKNKDTLANINDDTSASPQRIGKYLMTVIEGGENTPFRPLTDYLE